MEEGRYDILFLGRMFPWEADQQIRRKARVDMQDAANVLQWNLIRGLRQNRAGKVRVVSYLPVSSWPRHYRDPFVRGQQMICMGDVPFSYVSFCNVTCLKQITNRHACDRAAAAWAAEKTGKQKLLILYSCKNILMRAALRAKQVNPDVKVIQIIADITEFSANDAPNPIRDAFTRARMRENSALERVVDAYVLLTEHMKTRLGITKPYVVMEGILPERPAMESCPSGEKTILYTGSMNRKYGILTLLEAFSLIPGEDYQLVLCGLGNAEPEIRDCAARDGRIRYLGKIPHAQVLKLQSEAGVLVNPRQNTEEFTKYSFPSKTLEYLASGVPLVAYKLDGIPDVYDAYIHYAADNSPRTLADTLVRVAEAPEESRRQWAGQAEQFVRERTNPQVQTRKILDLAEGLCRSSDGENQ